MPLKENNTEDWNYLFQHNIEIKISYILMINF